MPINKIDDYTMRVIIKLRIAPNFSKKGMRGKKWEKWKYGLSSRNETTTGHIFYDQFVKKGDEPWSERLPKDLMPLTYDVFVQPYFPSSGAYYWSKNMTFDSTVNVCERNYQTFEIANFCGLLWKNGVMVRLCLCACMFVSVS